MPWKMKQQRVWSLHIRLVQWTMLRWIKQQNIDTTYVLLACLVGTINNTNEDRLRIMHLAGNRKVGYIQRWSPFIMQLKFYLLCTTQKQFVLYSLLVQCSLRLTTLSYPNAILNLETQKATLFSTKPSNKRNHCVIFRLVRLTIS